MHKKYVYLLSAVMAGGLAFAGVTAATGNSAHRMPAHTSLAADTSLPGSLDSCPDLAEGASSDCVAQLQTELNAYNGANLPVDGVFGPATENAVLAFQQREGVTPDGIVGIQTRAAFDRVSGSAVQTPSLPAPSPTGGSGTNGVGGLPINCNGFGQNLSVHGAGLFNGQFCMTGLYSGNQLTGLRYRWNITFGAVCLWWVDFNVYGAPPNAGLITHSQGGYNATCDGGGHGTRYSGTTPVPLPITAPIGGQVCATFWRQGSTGAVRVAGACQAITGKTGQFI